MNISDEIVIEAINAIKIMFINGSGYHDNDNYDFSILTEKNNLIVFIDSKINSDISSFEITLDSVLYYQDISDDYNLIIPDADFTLPEDYFQLSTMYPLKLSTYLEIRELRKFLILKGIIKI